MLSSPIFSQEGRSFGPSSKLGKAQPVLARLVHEACQLGLAPGERQRAQVLAVELQKIERPDAQVPFLNSAEVQSAEVRQSGFGAGGELTINDARAHGEQENQAGDGGEPLRKVVAVPRIDARAALMLVELDAPAVELHFVYPSWPRGGVVRKEGRAGGMKRIPIS
jgi:hypothetical protein